MEKPLLMSKVVSAGFGREWRKTSTFCLLLSSRISAPMTTFWNRVSRAFKIGRSRYYIGRDLNHNGYYEYPALDGSSDPRRTRRLVQYHEHKELGEHDQNSLPIQWLMWLRHTRKSAPTIEVGDKGTYKYVLTNAPPDRNLNRIKNAFVLPSTMPAF